MPSRRPPPDRRAPAAITAAVGAAAAASVADRPPLQCFRLEIQPEAPGRPWSAALVACPNGVRAEFTSPLALLRFITRSTQSAPRGGLR